MTFAEATTALAAGKRLRRPTWQSFVFIEARAGGWLWSELVAGSHQWCPRIEDLAATDWEEHVAAPVEFGRGSFKRRSA